MAEEGVFQAQEEIFAVLRGEFPIAVQVENEVLNDFTEGVNAVVEVLELIAETCHLLA